MPRLSRTRASRAIITVVVSGIVIGAFVEFKRTHRQSAASATLPPAAQPVRAAVASAVAPAPVSPVVTRTPGSGGGIPLYAATGQPTAASPAAVSEPVAPTASAAAILADAKAKENGSDLLAARKLLNDALLAGGLSDGDTAAVKKELSDVNRVLLFSDRQFANDPLGGTYKVGPGDRLASIALAHDVPFELIMQLNHITDPRRLKSGKTLKVIKGPFFAVVTKSKFNLDLYLGAPGGPGSTYVTSYPVGLGENDTTPTGLWEIRNKAANPTYYSSRGEGVIASGDPKNPLGPYWLGLEGTAGHAVGQQSYGIHGTIDPSSIGRMASQGCIRMRNEDVTVVYRMLIEHKSIVKVQD